MGNKIADFRVGQFKIAKLMFDLTIRGWRFSFRNFRTDRLADRGLTIGANFLFMDGSVRFIKSSSALPTIWALCTRNGGEIISSDAY